MKRYIKDTPESSGVSPRHIAVFGWAIRMNTAAPVGHVRRSARGVDGAGQVLDSGSDAIIYVGPAGLEPTTAAV